MVERLFTRNNTNADAMIVPQEEGGTSDDHYFGSIGDATMQHVFDLTDSDRQLWEGLIHMRSGTLFRTYPNPQDHDPDPYKLKGKKLENYLEVYRAEVKRNTGAKLTDEDLIGVREAIEEEQARREESNDIYEQSDVVPYHEWQNNPHLWSQIDIPSTPQDRFAFMGNTSQMFYDWFPEGHPDSKIINQCLMILNREFPLDINDGYTKFVCDWLDNQRMHGYVRMHLKKLVFALNADLDDPDELVKSSFQAIDYAWGQEYSNSSASIALKQKMTKVILHKEKEWEAQYKEGFNVYTAIKSFGRILFENYREYMNGWHWNRYRAAKRKYAPRVILYGYDINRCTLNELTFALNTDRNNAEKVWFGRPFETLEGMYNSGFLTGQSFVDDETTDKLVCFLEKHAKIAKDSLNIKYITDVCSILLNMQREKKGDLSNNQWSMIWRYYKILKADVLKAINGERLNV